MKKILLLLLSIALSFNVISTTFAEREIKGLEENLNELLMRNHFTQEELSEMEKEYMEYTSEYLLNTYIPLRQELRKMETGSVEEEYKLLMEQLKINIANGLKISHFSNGVYSDQYAQEGCFEYLFSEEEYWRAPLASTGLGNSNTCYQINGERFADTEENTWIQNGGLLAQDRILRVVENSHIIEGLLLERGEKEVEDIKICALSYSRPGLYIKCPEQEYFLKTYDRYSNEYIFNDDTYYEFMTIEEAAQEGEDQSYDIYGNYETPIKPTFDEEATTLQNKGLLYGNEKGLDLLKPLTRIEATTMLLRALDESTINETDTQTFTDVPTSYWGYGAAEKAYSLGLVMGVGDNKFAPNDMVTGTQFATMVLRAGNRSDFNWKDGLDILIAEGVISEADASTMDFFTRGDMAKIIYETIEKGLL